MPVRRNGYYTDPALAKSFDNLAEAFKTPSGSDVYGYVKSSGEREKAARLADLYAYAKSADYDQTRADRMGIAAGNYAPTQSFYAVDEGNDVALRNNAATNAASLAVADKNNAGALARQYAQPVIVGDGQTVRLPAQTAAATGLPDMFRGNITANQGQTVTTPTGEVISGAPKPMSETEMKAVILGQLPANEQRAVALAPAGTSAVVTPEGPRNVFAADSVGQEPYNVDTRQPQIANYKTPDGKVGSASLDKNSGKWKDTQTGADLPQGVQTYTANLQGDQAQTGLGAPTKTNQTQANAREAEVTRTLETLDLYEGIIRNNPGSIGLPGLIRGTAQDVAAVATDVAKAFGKSVPQIEGAAADIRKGMQSVAPEYFDPAIPEAQFLQGTLAYALARTENPSGEVSRQAFERAHERVRGGLLANPDRASANIGAFRKTLDAELKAIQNLRAPGTGRTSTAYPGGATPAASPSSPAPEVWERGPDGQLRRAQ